MSEPEHALASRARFAGLPARAAALVREAARALERRDGVAAERPLRTALHACPAHVEVQRLLGIALHLQERYAEALAVLSAAAARAPHDALVRNNLGSTLRACGRVDDALAEFRAACELAPQLVAGWFNLGKSLKSNARPAEARTALHRALECDPDYVPARIVLGDTEKALGDIPAAIDAYRRVLALRPNSATAWFGLANLKTVRFDEADIDRMMHALVEPQQSVDDRISLAFALSKGLEDRDRYDDAFAVLQQANQLKRAQVDWDAREFSAQVDDIAAAFAAPGRADAADTRGREVIFVVSMPRSGSTLTEQILAAHPDVEGASELPDLGLVVHGESERRGAAFPRWVADATSSDWARLGDDYLARTMRWRQSRPRFTDKGLANWQLIGGALAMLPGARVVVCRRDPVETCLSCYRQLFARGQHYSYDLVELARYWRDFDRLTTQWVRDYPAQVQVQTYEDLLADPEAQTRRLLAFCGLPFAAECLDFHQAERVVRTASAAQVRQPLFRDSARAPRFGAALDPLRAALGG